MSVNVEKNAAGTLTGTGTAYSVPRVNLLPPEILAERTFQKTKLGLAAVVLAVAAGLVGGFVLAQMSANEAGDQLVAEQGRTATLSNEQTQYAEVPQVIGQVDSAKTAQATAMATDVLWFDYLDHIAASYPADVWLRDMTVTVAAPTALPADTAAALVPLSPTIGTITVNGTGRTHEGTASWLDVMAATPGLADPLYSASSRTELEDQVVVDFTSTVNVTPDALSDRYEIKAS